MSGEDRVAGIRVIIVLILAEMFEAVVANETSQYVKCSLSWDAMRSHISPDTFERRGTDMTMQPVEDFHLQNIEVAS